MSTHYIYLSCSAPGCTAFEQIYTGDIQTDFFPDSGPDSFEGETISVPCNDHAAEARRLLEQTTPAEADLVALDLAEAQVHATLALAEQQRTANLIAFVQSNAVALTHEQVEARALVRARLGLAPTTPNQEQ